MWFQKIPDHNAKELNLSTNRFYLWYAGIAVEHEKSQLKNQPTIWSVLIKYKLWRRRNGIERWSVMVGRMNALPQPGKGSSWAERKWAELLTVRWPAAAANIALKECRSRTMCVKLYAAMYLFIHVSCWCWTHIATWMFAAFIFNV